jgi:hypothetical protein
VLPTSPIYRGPNPTHIKVQNCSHKGSKALPTSQGTWAFALGWELRSSATGHSGYPHKGSQATGQTGYPHKDFPVVTPENHATGHSSHPHKGSQATGQSSYPHKSSLLPIQGICETGQWHAFSFPLHPKGQDFNQFASGLDLKRCQ